MQETLIYPPRTAMQVFHMLPEGTLAEVIENQLYMSPTPNPFHQEISIELSSAIFIYVKKKKLGKVFEAPSDVYLDEHSNAVQPDIFFFSNENDVVIDKQGIHGVPDFIIEILSPGNKNYDLETKKNIYEKFKVKEYWVIDPETKSVKGFELEKNAFQQIEESLSQIKSPLLKKVFKF